MSVGLVSAWCMVRACGGGNLSKVHGDSLAQDCSGSIANAMGLLWSCAEPSICVSKRKCINATTM